MALPVGTDSSLMKCPLCGRPMSRMDGLTSKTSPPSENRARRESVFFCERHGVMNKPADLKEKVDEVERRTPAR